MNSLNTQDGIDQWLLVISGLKRACIDEDDSKVNWYVLMTPGLQLLSNPTSVEAYFLTMPTYHLSDEAALDPSSSVLYAHLASLDAGILFTERIC